MSELKTKADYEAEFNRLQSAGYIDEKLQVSDLDWNSLRSEVGQARDVEESGLEDSDADPTPEKVEVSVEDADHEGTEEDQTAEDQYNSPEEDPEDVKIETVTRYKSKSGRLYRINPKYWRGRVNTRKGSLTGPELIQDVELMEEFIKGNSFIVIPVTNV